MTAIYKKELKSYFNNMLGYLYIALLMLFMGIFAYVYNFKGGSTDIASPLGNLGFIFLLITPLLTMRIIAEERQRRTDTLLYSLPLSIPVTVIAKYLAMLTVFGIAVLMIAVYPIVLSFFGSVNFVYALGCIVGFFLEGATLLAIGMFISSLTENQAVAAVISFLVMLIIYFSSSLASLLPTTTMASFIALTVCVVVLAVILYLVLKNYWIAFASAALLEIILSVLYIKKQTLFEGLFADIFGWLSIFDRYITILNGVFDITVIIYYISLICLFVFLSVQSVEKRRWS